MLLSVLIPVLVSCFASVYSETNVEVPRWKRTLGKYRKWEGRYNYQSQIHHCKMIVHSVQLTQTGGMLATFKDETMNMDIEGYSKLTEEDVIEIRKVTAYDSSVIFPATKGFRAYLKLRLDRDRWVLSGNVTEPEGFSVIYLDAISSHNTASVLNDDQRASRIGLSVGIPLALAIILSIVAVSMIVWAVKRGYLRLRPNNYKHFRNNDMVTFNDCNQRPSVDKDSGQQMTNNNRIDLGETPSSVHI
ncbi:hypothetical protein SNE40_021366 [Patella caerulea]|uniref:Uncharacterized protein n=1 Tax=Patella caerulea TaxID=87958 RepID=A0AAN8GB51_PATCE